MVFPATEKETKVNHFAEGYARIALSRSYKEATQKSQDAWADFCDQPLDAKLKFTFENGCGYEYKGPEHLDHKENFHVRLDYDISHIENLTDVDVRFINAAKDVLRMRDPIEEFVRLMEESSETDFTSLIMENSDLWVLRFLHYFPSEKQALAAEHIDKGGSTLHIYESEGGFEYLDWNGDWKSMSFNHDEAVVFPSMQAQFHSEGMLRALWHRVKPTETSKTKGRYSIVLFLDYNSPWKYDKGRWGATQKAFAAAGCTYTMNHEEFKKYFTDKASAE